MNLRRISSIIHGPAPNYYHNKFDWCPTWGDRDRAQIYLNSATKQAAEDLAGRRFWGGLDEFPLANFLVGGNGALGEWELNVIQTVKRGVPMSFGFTGSPFNYLPGTQRADMAAGWSYDSIRLDWDRKGPCRHQVACNPAWADVDAFAYPAVFTACNSGRNILTGPGNLWHQVSISKTFTFRERLKRSLRAANRVNFGKITGNQGSFSGLGGRLYQQLVFKMEF